MLCMCAWSACARLLAHTHFTCTQLLRHIEIYACTNIAWINMHFSRNVRIISVYVWTNVYVYVWFDIADRCKSKHRKVLSRLLNLTKKSKHNYQMMANIQDVFNVFFSLNFENQKSLQFSLGSFDDCMKHRKLANQKLNDRNNLKQSHRKKSCLKQWIFSSTNIACNKKTVKQVKTNIFFCKVKLKW